MEQASVEAVTNHPDSVDLLLHRSHFLLVHAQKPDAASEVILRALELESANPNAYFWNGRILFDQRDFEKAIEQFQHAISLEQSTPNGHDYYGRILLDQRELDGEMEHFKAEHDARTHYWLGRALTANHQPDDAIKVFRDAIEINPQSASSYNNIGIVYLNKNQPDEAIEAFQTAIEIQPDHVHYYWNLVPLLLRQERLEEALEAIKTATELDPEHAETFHQVGKLLRGQGWGRVARNADCVFCILSPDSQCRITFCKLILHR